MERRKFITKSSLALGGALLLPEFLFACKKSVLKWEGDFNGKIIIVGAGAAGLYAGYLLNELGIDFTILEASSTIGGRLGKNDTLADFPVDLGAEWLHGKRSIAGDLADDSDTEYYTDKSEGKYYYKGEIVEDLPGHLESAINKLENSESDMSYVGYFNSKGARTDDYNIISFLSGELGASPEKISLGRENLAANEWSSGNKDYKFKDTYFDLINNQIIRKISSKIITNVPVSNIDYTNKLIKITDTNGTIHEAFRVILALPLPILKDGDITFNPSLTAEKTQAFSELEMEAGMKIFIKFSSKFYETGLIGGEKCPAYVDETYGLDVADNIMLGFVMGDKAKHLSDVGEATAISEILAELDAIYDGQATPAYQNHFIQDWLKKPFIRGAYSYSGFDTKPSSRKNAAKSIDDKLYFAGEFTNFNGHHQTVHGALESGLREVEKILDWEQ